MKAMITCPTTGKTVPSGLGFSDLASFDSNKLIGNYVRCSACGEMHLVDDTTVKVFPSIELGDDHPSEDHGVAD
jgi:hypothetical protein